MLEGTTEHEDFAGHRGKIGPGDLQWMTAGRGIVHAEMPGSSEEFSRGLQLWINLPSHAKMKPPAYQELLDSDVPRALVDGGETATVKVIAGEAFGVNAAVRTHTKMMYLDVKLRPGKCVEHTVPTSYTGFMYILSGRARVGLNGDWYDAHTTLVMDQSGDRLPVEAPSEGDEVHYVLIAGEPIGEPVAQYGPFVMNTREELQQAMMDYQLGQNGFEKAPEWRSELRDRYGL